MPQLRFETSSFPPGTLPNGSSICTFSWADLVWAAITVGKRELYHVTRHGQYSAFEIAFRSAILFANLKETPNGWITRSDVYEGLDPSEKAATSYFIGLTIGKLLAELYLDVPWLMHLDVYRHRVQAQLTGRSRPDLIGQDSSHRWVVLESKGRTGERDDNAFGQAKRQAQQITAIGGQPPHLRIGLLADFRDGQLAAEWQDPSADERKAVSIDVSEDDITNAYYRPFETLLAQREAEVARVTIEGLPYDTVPVRDADLRIGIRPDVRAVRERRIAVQRRIHQREDGVAEGGDGIAVLLGSSWSAENMRLESQARVTGLGVI